MAAVLVLVAGSLLLHAVGLSDRAVGGIALVAAGFALAWRQGGSFRPGEPLSYGGLAARGRRRGAAARGRRRDDDACSRRAPSRERCCSSPGPWLWRLALDRDAERAARIRSEERSEVAARVHDSVLQTLALIQRHAQEPRRVASLARRQERELRGWLYGDRPLGDEARRSSPRSPRSPPTSRRCTASASSSRARATARPTTRSCSPRARR